MMIQINKEKNRDDSLFGYKSPPHQRKPHRYVIKWMQALHLSRSFKKILMSFFKLSS